ncbi:hypothetical protein BJ742DRAFT_822473 [Cladochytrium replicatum]|nr:hypothetical protein BJ742DRAFT_822473 [Cladochytrium replicatum]
MQNPFGAAGGAGPTGPARHGEDFYQILGIDRSANDDAIKKAYRRMALRYHPDKTGHDPAAAEQFQKVQHAYTILSDEKKRRIYDKYGERGVQMTESMGGVPFIDPEALLAMRWSFFFGTLIVSVFVLFPIFVALRADSIVTWSWFAVFAPLYAVDLVVLSQILRSSPPDEDEEKEEDEDEEESERTRGGSSSSSALGGDIRADATSRREAKREKKRIEERNSKIFRTVYTVLCVVVQILLPVKLDGLIGTTSWVAVFAPWFLLEIVNAYSLFQNLLLKYKSGVILAPTSMDEEGPPTRPLTGSEQVVAAIKTYRIWVVRVIQLILIILRADGTLAADWRLVFIPSYLLGLIELLFIVYSYVLLSRGLNDDGGARRREKGAGIILKTVVLIVMGTLFYTLVGLLVTRLLNDDADPNAPRRPPASTVLVPIFIVLGVVFCCTCCCLPCLVYCMRLTLESEFQDGQDVVIQEIVNPNRRIEFQQSNGAAVPPAVAGSGSGTSGSTAASSSPKRK